MNHTPGIHLSWAEGTQQIDRLPGGHDAFDSYDAAVAWLDQGSESDSDSVADPSLDNSQEPHIDDALKPTSPVLSTVTEQTSLASDPIIKIEVCVIRRVTRPPPFPRFT